MSQGSVEGSPLPSAYDAHFKTYNSTADEVWRPETSGVCDSCRQPWPCDVSVLSERLAAIESVVNQWRTRVQDPSPQDCCDRELARCITELEPHLDGSRSHQTETGPS